MGNSFIDLIIRIKNGYLARKDSVDAAYSKLNAAICTKLIELKFIKAYIIEGETVKKISIELLYNDDTPALTDVKVMSRPGQRQYISYNEIKPVVSGLGYSIISTSKGIMTNRELTTNKIGGELLFNIW